MENKTTNFKNYNLKDLKDRRVLVVGLGISGKSVIKKLAGYVKHITAIDSNPYIDVRDEFENLNKIKNFSFSLILNENVINNINVLQEIDFIIVSPGVSNDILILNLADKKGIPVFSELEIGWMFLKNHEKKNTIAVTGTNGKTTVVNLIEKILSNAKKAAISCGNIGNPLINTISRINNKDILDLSFNNLIISDSSINNSPNSNGNNNPNFNNDSIIRVIEVSSFQLERILSFNPKVGIILNITDDHLDRHHSMENYASIKFNLFKNFNKDHWAVLNIDDEQTSKFLFKMLAEKGYKLNELDKKDCLEKISLFKKFNLITYSLNSFKFNTNLYLKDSKIFYSLGDYKGTINISKVKLRGKHNILNIMSAIAAVKIFGVSDAEIENTLCNFSTLEHRIEYVGNFKGINVYNDSKATNPDATIKALESFEREVTLILGGKDKDMDFSTLLPVMDRKILNLILIGEAKVKLLKTIESHAKNILDLPYNVYLCNSFEEAVEKGLNVTEKGKVLLLSPACASFDMFQDYKDRGKKFKNLIFEKARNQVKE